MSKRPSSTATETQPGKRRRQYFPPRVPVMWARTDPPGLPPMVGDRTDPCDPMAGAQEWENPQLWSALSGPPDTDNVDGVWIVSHVRCPIAAIVQVVQQGALWPDAVPDRLVADRRTTVPAPLSSTISLWLTSTLRSLTNLSSGSRRSPSGPLRSLLMCGLAPFSNLASRCHSHLTKQPGETSTGNAPASEARRLSR